MNKILKVTNNSYCVHRFYNRLLLNCPKPNMYAVSSMTYPQNNRHYTDQHRLLKCCHGYRNKTPHYLSMCNFHLSSVFYRIRMSKKLKKHVKGTNSFENKNWNLQSDLGLNELLEDMKRELTNSETNFSSETDEADSGHADTINDPELKEILADIRKDFQDKKYPENNFVDNIWKKEHKTDEETDNMTESYGFTAKSTVEIEDFTHDIEEEDVQPEWVPPVEFKRGSRGVFDIDDLVTVLRAENAKDICVIELPEHLRLADYMVIVSGISFRHCRAITSAIQWIYKKKKYNKDHFLKVEGLNSKDWLAFDLGNIILHVFMPETRKLYDLETLWTVGEKYDDRCLDVDDQFSIKQSDLEWLQELDISRNTI